MDAYRHPEQVIIPAAQTDIDAQNTPRKNGLFHTVFTTNWGFVLIAALVALGLGVSALHADHVESTAAEAEIESVIAA